MVAGSKAKRRVSDRAVSVRFENVSKGYGDFPAARDVSFQVPAGELFSLLGPSGSGKSTLLRVLAGLIEPESGRVWISDKDVTALPTQKRDIGFVFQHYALFKHMTVRENVGFGLSVRHAKKKEIDERVDSLLEKVRLVDKVDRLPAELSGGERQRVALARALAPRPAVLLLDEPFAAVDAAVRAELREWVLRIHEDDPITTILVTHDQEEALELSDEVVVLNEGRVQQVGTPEQIYEQPANEFVAAFVGPVNKIRFGPNELYVRPSDVGISVTGEEHCNGTIERVSFLGDTLKVHVRLNDGQILIAHVLAADAIGQDFRAGVSVRADWRAAKRF
ncbi:MAG: sulfate/thiosulfate transport system ATP-binding protein [Fimbriimonadaceae bacterium]|jgi:sulfate transport system ATP-binding protein|nr:sulfate/thiosulfate transport system ATP-binding protein [Fimbriimonadaceae bacterium]